MKKLNLDPNPENYHEVAKEDLLFIGNESVKELVGALANALKPTGADHVLLTGCSIIESNTSVSIADGFVFTGGEIYRVVASGFIFPAELPDGTDPLTQVWLVPEEQTLPNADRTYEDGRSWRVFRETALKLSGSSTNAIMRLDELSYYANTSPSGTIRMWRPPAGKSIADVAKFPSGRGKGEFLGWQLLADSGGRMPMGMNWDQTAVAGVREAGSYQNVEEKDGKSHVLLQASESGFREHVHAVDARKIIQSSDTNGYGLDEAAGNTARAFLTNNTSGSSSIDGEAGRNGSQPALQSHENRPPFFMVYYFIKN